jgi:hypothetical protein
VDNDLGTDGSLTDNDLNSVFPWKQRISIRVLREKLIVAHLVKEFVIVHEPENFIAMFTRWRPLDLIVTR